MGTRPPPRVPPVRIASPTPLSPSTPSFGWLLRNSIKRQPPKTALRPSLNFFNGHHFGAQNKGTNRIARKPWRRAPLLGSLGASAPRFGSMADVAMEIDGLAAGGRAVQQLLILWCVRWDFGGIFRASAPLGIQQSHQKIPSPKKGIYSTYDNPHTKKRWYLSSKPPTTGNFGGNEGNPTMVGFCIIMYNTKRYTYSTVCTTPSVR
jgi:hypothetical protein